MSTIEKPRPEIAVDGFSKRQSGFGQMITSADHKDVAKILMVGSGGFLFIAALEFFLMRLQLAIPENTFMEPVMFNRMLSLYGATSIFFFALPLVMGIFLYVAPLPVGARGGQPVAVCVVAPLPERNRRRRVAHRLWIGDPRLRRHRDRPLLDVAG